MTISSLTNRNDYVGNGSLNTYSYTFKIFNEEHLAITVADTSGVESDLVLATDYTVTGVGETAGGTIVLVNSGQSWLTAGNLTTGYALTIQRRLPLLQETDIRNQGDFFPEVHENQFDRDIMIAQQLSSIQENFIRIPTTESPTDAATIIPAVAVRSSKFFKWDGSGDIDVSLNDYDALPSGQIWLGNGLNQTANVTPSGDVVISNAGVTSISADVIVNSDVNSAAAIAYSKLDLTNGIVNADVNASAAIVYSKLDLSGGIVNNDVNNSAAIVYSKLNLSGGIVNSDINSGAAIVYSKLNLTNTIINADINASAGIVYSKLFLVGSIINNDISGSAGILFSKMASLTANRVPIINNSNVMAASAWGFDEATENMTTGQQDEFRYRDSASNYVSFKAPVSVSSSYSVVWPAGQAVSSDTFLRNDGAGNLTWVTLTGGGGTVSPGAQYELAYYPSAGNTVDGSPVIMTNIVGQMLLSDRAAGSPSYSFINDPDTGIYSYAANEIAFSCNATYVARFDANGLEIQAGTIRVPAGTSNAPSYTFWADSDTGMYSQGSNFLNFTAGTVLQMTMGNGYISVGSGVITEVDPGLELYPSLVFSGDRDTGFYHPAANTIGIVTSGVNHWKITDSITQVTSSGTISIADGSASAPVLTFAIDTDTGIYRISDNLLGFAASGGEQFRAGGGFVTMGSGVGLKIDDGLVNYPSLSFRTDPDTGLFLGSSGGAYIGFSIGATLQFYAQSGLVMNTGTIKNNIGSVSAPSYTFWNDTDTGLYGTSDNKIHISTGGVKVATFSYINSTNGQFSITDGSNSIPAYSFISDPDSGIFSAGANLIGIASGGAYVARFDPSGIEIQAGSIRNASGTVASPSYSFWADNDTGIYTPSPNELAITCGGAEKFRINTANSVDDIRMAVYDYTAGGMAQVSRGASNSGGTGYRLLRVPN